MYTEKDNLNRSINLMMSKQHLKSKILKHGRMLDEEVDKVQKQQI
jgi:serine/threonine protein phosphatase PrpC